MSRWKFFGASLAILLVGVLAASLVPAMSQGGRRFVLCEKNGRHDYEKDIDSDGDGEFSAGDQFIFSEPEYDNSGDRIGKSAGTGTLIRLLGERDGLLSVNVSLNLKGGRLEVQGAVKFSSFRRNPSLPIVGGSGQFAGAGGTITINERAGCGGFPKADKLTVELR